MIAILDHDEYERMLATAAGGKLREGERKRQQLKAKDRRMPS